MAFLRNIVGRLLPVSSDFRSLTNMIVNVPTAFGHPVSSKSACLHSAMENQDFIDLFHLVSVPDLGSYRDFNWWGQPANCRLQKWAVCQKEKLLFEELKLTLFFNFKARGKLAHGIFSPKEDSIHSFPFSCKLPVFFLSCCQCQHYHLIWDFIFF